MADEGGAFGLAPGARINGNSLSISRTDPNLLLVACGDPCVRLYDRRLLPPPDSDATCHPGSFEFVTRGVIAYMASALHHSHVQVQA